MKNDYSDIFYNDLPDFLIPFINLNCVQRLKDVSYFCGMDYGPKDVYSFLDYYSRYDHSLNTAMMYYNFTKDKKGSIAMLLHDVSSPVFSHVVDIMQNDSIKQEYTESFNSYILSKEADIYDLLYKEKMVLSDLDMKKYNILDNDRPKLCIDRLDAVFAGGLFWNKGLNINLIKRMYNDLTIFVNEDSEEEIGFKDINVCKMFFDYALIDAYNTSSYEDVYSMNIMATIIKMGIDIGMYSVLDLFSFKESEFLDIIRNSELFDFFDEFKNIKRGDIIYTSVCESDFYSFSLKTKKRYIDPLINGYRLSDVNYSSFEMLNKYLNKSDDGYVTNKMIRRKL